jgi:hypothetical protein
MACEPVTRTSHDQSAPIPLRLNAVDRYRDETSDPRLYDEDGNANPLMRASEFCAALYDWRSALSDAIADPDVPEHRKVEFRQIVASLNAVELPIRKSNYLWRRIYLAQQHRTEKCPDHKGTWSGYGTPPYVCACMSGYDVTGWLPVEGDEQAAFCAPDPNLTADGSGGPFGV